MTVSVVVTVAGVDLCGHRTDGQYEVESEGKDRKRQWISLSLILFYSQMFNRGDLCDGKENTSNNHMHTSVSVNIHIVFVHSVFSDSRFDISNFSILVNQYIVYTCTSHNANVHANLQRRKEIQR